jgi:SagB-type dehydrogenase family enzyme
VNRLAPFESSIAERYHEETKYSEAGLRREASRHPSLDWSAQPVPFRALDGDRILLPAEGIPIRRQGNDEVGYPAAPDGHVDAARLARMLWHANGCTRIQRMPGGVHHFRAAPSAGAMYPTELYVVMRSVPGFDPGVYSYQILDHSLVQVRAGDPYEGLRAATFGHPAVDSADAAIVVSGMWFRSSWRYRERGYRRALLDSGHVLGNLVVGAAEEGLAALPLGCFRDELIENMLAVDPVEEGPLTVVPLVPAGDAAEIPRLPSRRSDVVEWRRALARVEDRVPPEAPERLIAALHLAGRLDAEADTVSGPITISPGAPANALVIDADVGRTEWPDDDPVTATIAIRRSTRRFRPEPLPKEALLRSLAYAMGPPEGSLFAPELLRTYLVSIDVVGLPPGSYLYDHEPARLLELSRGRLAEAMVHLGLGQEIFVNAGAVVVHTVDLTRAVQRLGDRVYRLLSLDAGHIGERLNLAALHEGLGVSGCGGYYDDEMNRALAIPENQAVIYITSLGVGS